MKSIGAMAGARLPRHLSARVAGWGTLPGALVWQPAPPVTGDPAVARRLASGILLFEGVLAETSDPHPWDVTAPDAAWEAALHGHAWLDHAAASSEPGIWDHFVPWVWEWLERYASGTGPGWRPDLVARRLTRWIAHSTRLLASQPPERSALFFQALGKQARFVDWRWAEMPSGVPRIEALTGLVYARLSLEETGRETEKAIADLGREAETTISPEGAVASRSPEALARIVSMLAWSLQSIEDAGHAPVPGHVAAIKRAIPVLRALRHPSGALARFHGGRPGLDLPLEEIIRTAGPAFAPTEAAPMGYYRLERNEGVVIADCAMPAKGDASATAHTSVLAFEFSHGAQPIVVNCGTGLGFGPEAAHAARGAAAHSLVQIGDEEPGTMAPAGRDGDQRLSMPGDVSAWMNKDAQGQWLIGESAVHEAETDLRLERRLCLGTNGDTLTGEDVALSNMTEDELQEAVFMDTPIPLRARFHLHPDIKASLALSGRGVSLRMPDGALWLFISDAEKLTLEQSRYFDEGRPRPRATTQIVALSHVVDYWGRITWSFERLPEGSLP